jgi:dienelactone hydrolase
MTAESRTRAPAGVLSSFAATTFTQDGVTHRLLRKGTGPAVIVITEMPGISPQVLGFADRIVAVGCTAVLPDLFGTAGRDPLAGGLPNRLAGLRTLVGACISREFTVLAAGRSSPVTHWLRGLAVQEHQRCGGPGVGVVGMCFTGGFALAMAADPVVVAPVLSQPSLPLPIRAARKCNIDCSDADLAVVARRCAGTGLRVLGLRFEGDPLVPAERFAFLRQRLGDGFIAVTLNQDDGHPDGPLPRHHSVLTTDLIDEPGEPTHAALTQVLDLLTAKLRVPH